MDHATQATDSDRPLVIDLDGTLLNSDLLIESIFSVFSARPVLGAMAIASLLRGKAAFKEKIAAVASLDLNTLPFNEELLGLLHREKARGRILCLASASDRQLVEPIAAQLGLFDKVFASDGSVNLASVAKADALCAAFGAGGFDYVGNDKADIAVWEKAGRVIFVNASPQLRGKIFARFPHAEEIGRPRLGARDYLRAFRIHQWLKNLLIFVPAFAAHAFGAQNLVPLLLAFFAFSFCASSTYLLNDLFDLSNDRQHPRKRHRPFASGQISPLTGLSLAAGFLIAALVLALALPTEFLLILAAYFAVTISYSIWIKRQLMIDVLTLACLYGTRLVAGAVAIAVPLSLWFVGFSVFLFLSLATVKRCAELLAVSDAGRDSLSGRGYQFRDLPVLEGIAAASGYVAVMVFILYINNPAVAQLYRAPERLWLIAIVLLYWIGRVLILTHRGEMRDDPIVFAARDWISLLCAALTVAIVLASI